MFDFSFSVPVRLGNRNIGVNLVIFTVFCSSVSPDAAPTGLKNWDKRGSTQMPSLRD